MAANQTNQNIKKAQEETKEGIKKQGHGCEIKLVWDKVQQKLL